MHPTNCLNCATLLTADDNYCPTCGQKTDTHRLSMKHIWHEVGHAITHADVGILYTLRELALRPGIVAREYIQGKRKKYYNPFSLLIIILGIYILANSIFKPYSQEVFSQDTISTQSESKRLKFEKIKERQREMGEFMNHHVNIVMFISTPFLAFIFWLFFKKRFNYAEHLTTMAYVNSFLSVLTILIFGPLLYYIPDKSHKQAAYFAMLVVHMLYMSYMYYGLMGYTNRNGYFKALGASLVALISWGIFSGIVGFVYILWGVL